jgi:CheY-like chemotaxis protein
MPGPEIPAPRPTNKTKSGNRALRMPHPYAPCILVVDDEPPIRSLFTAILQDAGFFVSEATTGRQALHLLEERYFELVILDLSMPDIDGFDLLKIVRQELPHVKVLVISGYMQGPMLEAAKLFGAVGTLSKPSAPKTLLLKVCDILQSPGV